jgi:hypothetical protein
MLRDEEEMEADLVANAQHTGSQTPGMSSQNGHQHPSQSSTPLTAAVSFVYLFLKVKIELILHFYFRGGGWALCP